MAKINKYKAHAIPSPDPVIRVMPLIEELILSDLMPLLHRVIVKRVGLYLREIDTSYEQRKETHPH